MNIIQRIKDYFKPKEAVPEIIHTLGWCFSVKREGPDLTVKDVYATWFGGANDPQDNGQTASGLSTIEHPEVLGCALPVAKNHPSTKGSPLPRLPWHTKVAVTYKHTTILTELIDNGPARSTGNGIDLTQSAFRALGVPLAQGKVKVSYRVIGGAAFLQS